MKSYFVPSTHLHLSVSESLNYCPAKMQRTPWNIKQRASTVHKESSANFPQLQSRVCVYFTFRTSPHHLLPWCPVRAPEPAVPGAVAEVFSWFSSGGVTQPVTHSEWHTWSFLQRHSSNSALDSLSGSGLFFFPQIISSITNGRELWDGKRKALNLLSFQLPHRKLNRLEVSSLTPLQEQQPGFFSQYLFRDNETLLFSVCISNCW